MPAAYLKTGSKSCPIPGIFHKESLHEIIEIAVKHGLDVGCLAGRPQILYHLVRMKHVTSYLGTPFDFLFLPFKFCLLFLALPKLHVVEMRLQYAQGILPVVELRPRLGIFHRYDE